MLPKMGGGACHSVQISKVGEARAHLLSHDVDCIGGSPADSILVVELFGGMGGLSRALHLLGVVPVGLIFVDSNPRARKLEKSHVPYALCFAFTPALKTSLRKKFLGGG